VGPSAVLIHNVYGNNKENRYLISKQLKIQNFGISLIVKVKVKVKVKLSLFFNRAPRNEGVLGSGGITPRIL